MKKIFKRFGAMFLVVAMLVAMLPMTVLAKPGDEEKPNPNSHSIIVEGDGEIIIGTDRYTKSTVDGTFTFDFKGQGHIDTLEFNDDGGFTITCTPKPKPEAEPKPELKAGGEPKPVEEPTSITLESSSTSVEWFYNDGQDWCELEAVGDDLERTGEDFKTTYAHGFKAVFPNAPTVTQEPTVNGPLTYNFRNQKLIKTEAIAEEGATVYYAVSTKVDTETGEPEEPGEDDWKINTNNITGEDADTYYVWYYAEKAGVKSDPEYVEDPVVIKPLKIPVYWFNDNNFTYDGTPHKNPTAISFLNLAGKMDVKLVSFNGNDVEDKKLEDAGTYVFEATSTNKNFVFSTSTTTVKVSKATFAVVWPRKTYVYNDEVQKFPEVTLLGLGKKPEKVEVSIEKYKGRDARRRTKFEDAGTYLLKATSTNPNYNLINDTKEYEIYKALVKLPEAVDDLVYNGEEQTGVKGQKGLYRVENGKATNAGEYKARVKLVDSKNYQWILGRGEFSSKDQNVPYVIAKNELDITDFRYKIPEDTDYTGRPVEAGVELARKYDGRRSGNELEVWYVNEEGKTVEKPVVPGTYTVMAAIEGSRGVDNFFGGPVELGEFTIKDVEIIEGDGSVYTKGSKETLKFVSNGPFKAFRGIMVDGKKVDKENYVAEEGSTVVTFDEEYAELLAEGEHDIVFVFGNRHNPVEASGTFTVKAAEAPKTGDESNSLIWIVMGSLAFLTMLGAAYTILRKDN